MWRKKNVDEENVTHSNKNNDDDLQRASGFEYEKLCLCLNQNHSLISSLNYIMYIKYIYI